MARAKEIWGTFLSPVGIAFLAGLAVSSGRMTLMIRHDAEGFRYIIAAFAFLGQVLSYWWAINTKFSWNPLRFPCALWLVSILTMLSAKKIVMSDVPIFLLWLSPLLFIAGYSWNQFRKPDGGKQIELPTDWVHSYKRLGWRWWTKPRLDFWFVWVGLLVSPTIGICCFVFGWNFGEGSAPAYFLRAYALFWLAVFIYQWVIAPRRREEFKMVYVAAAHTRVLGILYVVLFSPAFHSWYDRFGNFAVAFWLTGIFEHAYDKCVRRLTRDGIQEYEALEGPSLGL